MNATRLSRPAVPPPPVLTASALAVPALLIANICLACGPWMVRLARTESQIGPVASAFWRVALAVPVLLVVLWLRADRSGLTPDRQPLAVRRPRVDRAGVAAVAAGVLFAGDLAAWHLGILHTRLANATLLGNMTAVLFPAYGFLVARQWPNRRQGTALMLAVGGAVLLVGRSYSLSTRDIVGDLICIVAGLFYTFYLVASERARGTLSPLTVLTLSATAAAPCLLLAALATGEPVWPRDWTPLVLMSLGSQLIGQGLILYAIGRVTPLVVGVMLLLQPVVAAVIGWGIYGERLTVFDLAGAVAIGAAVLLIRAPRPLQADA